MVKRVFDELTKPAPQNHFTVGINDDVTHTSLDLRSGVLDRRPARPCAPCSSAWAADGTVGANKNTIKIIGEETDLNAQGYFVYDSKKSGAVTTSHLRFSQKPIRSTYLIRGQLRRLPSVQLPGAARCAEGCRSGRGLPAEQPVRARRGVGQPAANGAERSSSRRNYSFT